MATLRKILSTRAKPGDVWSAIADVGALHVRLVPGFVVHTEMEPGARVVTFRNGLVRREPIVSIDEGMQRLVWGSVGSLAHYNAALEVHAEEDGSRVTWTADFLPNEAAPVIDAMMTEAMVAMQATLDALAVETELHDAAPRAEP